MNVALLAGGLGLGLLLVGSRRMRRRVRPPVIVTPPPDAPRPSPTPRDPVAPAPSRARNRGLSRAERLGQLLDELVSNTPRLGRLVQLDASQTPLGAVDEAFRAAGLETFVQQREHYAHCMASGRFNSSIYGTPSVSKRFPKSLLAPGTGIGLRVAFLPRNEDAMAALRVGRMPRMTVDRQTGAPLTGDTSLGLLWFPPIDEVGVRAGLMPSCAAFSWADGASAIDPPSELLALLEEHSP